MRFSANTDLLDSPPLTKSEIVEPLQNNQVVLPPKRQPHYLVPDALLEIMGWLAFTDWLVLSDPLPNSQCTLLQSMHGEEPGYSLIRATHVCRYWRVVGLENRSLWRYISLSETKSRNSINTKREFEFRVQRSIGLAPVCYPSPVQYPH
jgi:F-box-like